MHASHEASRLRAVVDTAVDGVILINADGVILMFNPACERLFGYAAFEVIGRNVKMLMPTPYQGEHDIYLRNYRETGVRKIIGIGREVLGRKRGGTTFPMDLSVAEASEDGLPIFVGIIRDISVQKLVEQKLQNYYDQTQSEQQLALRLMDMQLRRPGLEDPRLRYKVIAAENFSGDIVAASRSPEGRFYALLADATGHGLAAAISVLPVLAIFYRLTRRNHPVREIIAELNQQLTESMPIGRFVATTLVCLDEITKTGEIWVGGTPSAFLLDRWGRSTQEFLSINLPLGIVDNEALSCTPVSFCINRTLRVNCSCRWGCS